MCLNNGASHSARRAASRHWHAQKCSGLQNWGDGDPPGWAYCAPMHDYTRLRVWQRAQKLAQEVYRDTDRLDEQIFPGVASELRRTVDAIAINIVEGTRQATPSLFAKSLLQSITNAADVQRQLLAAHQRGIIDHPRHVMLDMETQEIRRMLHALRARILEKINLARAKKSGATNV